VRIPFPERVPINRVAIFAVVLFLIQRFEGTALYFSAGCAVFILVAAVAFNAAGGLTRASGAYVFFYSLLVVIVGICYKAYLGEPAQSNLRDPRTDIEIYVGSITAMLAAVIVSRRISRKSGLLKNMLRDSEMYRASVGCIVFGVVGATLIALLGEASGQVNSAFSQLNQLIPVGIIIGVMYEIRRSGGTRSLNLPILLAAVYVFVFFGLFSFSKQGMLLPVACWVLPVCALRFRLSALQIVSCFAFVFIVFYYLVPYAQYGRKFIEPNMTLSQHLALTTRLLESPEETRQNFEQDFVVGGYYNTPQGFWDRLQFVSVDDKLINVTDQGKVIGLLPVTSSLLNAVPHFLWPNKPNYNLGNLYSHEIGGMTSEEDITTGVSFSPTSEAYHMKKWFGVLVIAPLVWLAMFVLFDSLCGDLRTTPWGLLVLAYLSHTAPEGAISGLIYIMTFGTEALLFCAFFAKWAAPFFAIPVLGPDRRGAASRISFQPSPQPNPQGRRL
jgi:hypothetical protein